MDKLFSHLEVLSRCIHYRNLSVAAQNVGLSQPQLSRVINSIEEELEVVLLNREVKRKSYWMPIAYELARSFQISRRQFLNSMEGVKKKMVKKELSIATMEGLASLALDFTEKVFASEIQKVELDILDINEMEQVFFNGNKDLIFSFRKPRFEKVDFIHQVGYQHLTKKKKPGDDVIVSAFLYGKNLEKYRDIPKKIFVSNSLKLREDWLERRGGETEIPSDIYYEKQKNSVPVYLIGQKNLNQDLWKELVSYMDGLKKLF